MNQKQRTRRALLDAACQLAGEGKSPTIPEVAAVALVSPATAYRYFPSARALMLEVASRQLQPEISTAIESFPPDPEERIDQLVRVIAEFQLGNEELWRAVLGASLERWTLQREQPESERMPVRGSHRLEAIDQALAPLRGRLSQRLLHRLTMATMLVCGVEAMVSARDACELEPAEAGEVMRWAARALQRAAVQEAEREAVDTDQPDGGEPGSR